VIGGEELESVKIEGWSIQNLKLMRQFYKIYSKPQIGQPLISQSDDQIGQPVVSQFSPLISCKHYILLMHIIDPNTSVLL
jgi:hypothetical protein